MNLFDIEANLKKTKEWFFRIQSSTIKCILAILVSISLWLVKLVPINFILYLNQWFIQQFRIDLINNGVFSSILWISTVFSLLIICNFICKWSRHFLILTFFIPYDYKHLSLGQKALLYQIYTHSEDLDCQYAVEDTRLLEKKHMISTRRSIVGSIDSWPLYAKINSSYKKMIINLIKKDNRP